MTSIALSLNEVKKNFGLTPILRGVNLEVRKGERHAIIGPNGAGKSTMFHTISGRLPLSSGTVVLNGETISGLAPYKIVRRGLSRNFQVTNLFAAQTVIDNLRCAVLSLDRRSLSFWSPVERRSAARQRAEEVLCEIGLEARRDTAVNVLSYAEQRALEIGVAVAGGADTILLDEPTAGMSNHETDRAIALIERVTAGKTLVMVEHDMSVVFQLADRISVLVYGQIIATDTPERIRANPAVQEAYLGSAHQPQALEQDSVG